MEGLLKVLADRDSDEARTALSEKFEQFAALMQPLLEQKHDVEPADEVPQNIKEEEATEAEDDDSADDLAASIVSKEAAVPNTVATAFSQNAKDFFVRAVFDGNEQDFDDTVTLLSHMTSFAEAEDYLYNDMMLDAKLPDVAKFMEVVSQNMPH